MSSAAPRVSMVVNPIAGGGQAERRAADVRQLLEAKGCSVDLLVTRASGDAARLAADAVRASAQVVLACGGDGTINEVAQSLLGTDVALAAMPLGTANILGHELGLSRDPRVVARVILEGLPVRMDAGRCGGRLFLCCASAGFDAAVTENISRWRNSTFSYLSYVRPSLRTLREYPFAPLRVTVDGEALDVPAYHVIVGNTWHYAGPFSVTRRASAEDGLLDAVAFCGPGRAWLFAHAAAMAAGVHMAFPNVHALRGRTITIEADWPMPVELDGDFATYAPVTLEVIPRAITVLAGHKLANHRGTP